MGGRPQARGPRLALRACVARERTLGLGRVQAWGERAVERAKILFPSAIGSWLMFFNLSSFLNLKFKPWIMVLCGAREPRVSLNFSSSSDTPPGGRRLDSARSGPRGRKRRRRRRRLSELERGRAERPWRVNAGCRWRPIPRWARLQCRPKAAGRGGGDRAVVARPGQFVAKSCSLFRFQVTNQVSEVSWRLGPGSPHWLPTAPHSLGVWDLTSCGSLLLSFRRAFFFFFFLWPPPSHLVPGKMLPAVSGPIPRHRFLGFRGQRFEGHSPYIPISLPSC